MVFTQHLRALNCAVYAAHDAEVLHHREATTPNCFLNGTGVGALPNKLPEERVACAFVHLYRGRCAYRTVISSRSFVVAYRGARWGLREPCGMVDPARSALSCGVWCVWVAYSQCRSEYATRF